MALIRIPEQNRPALRALIEMDDATADALATAVRNVPPCLSPDNLSIEVASRMPKDQIGRAVEILDALFGMYSTRAHFEISIDEFIDALIDSIRESEAFPEFNRKSEDALRSRLVNLLDFDNPLGITVKAAAVLTDHERLFYSSRILTDVRYVFGEDVSVAPEAAVIVHMLRINCRHEGATKQVYFALDTEDLQKLKVSIERAEAKQKTLKGILGEKNVLCLEAEIE